MSAAALAIGTGISTYASIAGGEAKKSAYELEARAKENQSAQVELAAQREINLTQRRYERTRDAQFAAFGKSGVQLSGSPLLLMEESAADAFDEITSIRQAADYRKQTLSTEAGLSRFMGDQAELAGYLSGATSILTGVSKNPYAYDSGKSSDSFGISLSPVTEAGGSPSAMRRKGVF